MTHRLCVFAGSGMGEHPAFDQTARALGEELGRRGTALVYGGASIGLMGSVADAVLGAGGQAIGVIPKALMRREVAHQGLTQLRVVNSMHERKAVMAELSDAFVALPGGLGTLEELLEAATWTQLGIHVKPCGVLNVDGYFDGLIDLLDRAVDERLLSVQHRRILVVDDDPESLLTALASWEAPPAKHRSARRSHT